MVMVMIGKKYKLWKTNPGAHPASRTAGIRVSFLVIKRPGRGAEHASALALRLKKE
jgi:hypothetical protein